MYNTYEYLLVITFDYDTLWCITQLTLASQKPANVDENCLIYRPSFLGFGGPPLFQGFLSLLRLGDLLKYMYSLTRSSGDNGEMLCWTIKCPSEKKKKNILYCKSNEVCPKLKGNATKCYTRITWTALQASTRKTRVASQGTRNRMSPVYILANKNMSTVQIYFLTLLLSKITFNPTTLVKKTTANRQCKRPKKTLLEN